MRQFTTSWVTSGTPGLFYFALRGHTQFVLFCAEGCIMSLFYQCVSKQIFCQSGATSSVASAAAHDSLLPILVQYTCTPHHGQCLAHLVLFILQWGLLQAPKCNPSRY
jgi:hypothetical protein